MAINSRLKKEGIQIVEKLDTLKVNTIANSIASKLCLAFPEHGLKKSELFECLSRLNMYFAKMPEDMSSAKYFYKDNSIYFKENIDIEKMPTLSIHECIHCIQDFYNVNKTVRMGLYVPYLRNGLSINEAAVQLMASQANNSKTTNEVYYGVSINTTSPDYYPLECSLLNQIAYFTGTYPLYHSTLNSNDVFKNTFIQKTDEATYYKITKNFDKLLSLENDLNYYSSELQYTDKINITRLLNNLINETKSEIKSLFFKTQNIIMSKCFKSEFNNIRNMKDIKTFIKKLYNYKNIIGFSEEYTYYNDFYCDIMNLVEEKKSYIEKYGEINLFENINNSLMIVDETKNIFSFITIFITKIRKLFGLNVKSESINNL